MLSKLNKMEKKFEIKFEHRRVMIEECVINITIDVPDSCSKKELNELLIEEINDNSFDVIFDRYEDFKGAELKEPEIKIIEINEEINVLKPLKIFHIRRAEEADYDEVQEFVIVAHNFYEVKKIALNDKGDESNNDWLVGSIVNELGLYTGDEKEPHVLCRNFKNG